eukprot:TRINITY_DN1970_c0_g1_i1.p1 TRINITY_DN1970_c0_g1~~TRINITY_DN1970_c0_g1_i1.p1  ORF type:complete len:764 (+),score=86.61 TRINITY_DN1970_c0_g1_i1:89-2380(+)
MPLYHGPLSSSPLVKKKERLTKVGHAEEWDDEENPLGHSTRSHGHYEKATAVGEQHVGESYPVLYAPPPVPVQQVVPQVSSGGSPLYSSPPPPMQYPYVPWPPMWPPMMAPPPGIPAMGGSPPMLPMPAPIPQPPLPSLPSMVGKHARVVSAPSTPGPGMGAKFGRRRPQSTGNEVPDDPFFWRLGMGEGEAERKAALVNARDKYKRELEEQIEERRRRQEADDDSHHHHHVVNPTPTAPGERTGRSDHSYARIRAQMFTHDDIEKQREKELQAKKLQHDLEQQIEERRAAKEAEERRRRESDQKWDAKYNKAARAGMDKEALEKERVKENMAIQEEAAIALKDPRFAPLKKVYHHQKQHPNDEPPPPLQPPPPRPKKPQTPLQQHRTPSPPVQPVLEEVHVEEPQPVRGVKEGSVKGMMGFNMSPELQPLAKPVVVASPLRFKPAPISYPDDRALDQERRIAALETAISIQQRQQLVPVPVYNKGLREIGRLTERNRIRLMQLNDVSRRIEHSQIMGSRAKTEEILRGFVGEQSATSDDDDEGDDKVAADPHVVDKIDRMFGASDIEEPIWLREANVIPHEAFSGATLPGKSEWVSRAIPQDDDDDPAWLKDEEDAPPPVEPVPEPEPEPEPEHIPKHVTIDENAGTVTTFDRTDAVSIPATHDVDGDYCSQIFPIGSRVDYKGQVGVIYRHSESKVTIYLDSTGEVLETDPPDLNILEYPPIRTTNYAPTMESNPTPEPSPPCPSDPSRPLPVPEEEEGRS